MIKNGITTTYTYDEENKLLSVNETPCEYDQNGRLLSFGNIHYSYNSEGKLIEVNMSGIS